MIYISVLDEKRGGREAFESFDTAAYMRKMFGMYGGDDEIVTLRCRNKMAGIMIDRFGSDAAFREDDPEHFMLTVKIAMSDHFVTWLMNFGHDVKIISPKSAIDRLISVANTALEVNQNCY
ncbi:hypothetical protein SDC9_147144 [bioreactor metagenome]|uniref:WCX domain-containing protein n=1 Tax=bioreactor metagenome TaxID=1076179 RepID=A0A645EF33_9ZZZZ